MTLVCTKTGRWWPVATLAAGYIATRLHGLKDYVIEA